MDAHEMQLLQRQSSARSWLLIIWHSNLRDAAKVSLTPSAMPRSTPQPDKKTQSTERAHSSDYFIVGRIQSRARPQRFIFGVTGWNTIRLCLSQSRRLSD